MTETTFPPLFSREHGVVAPSRWITRSDKPFPDEVMIEASHDTGAVWAWLSEYADRANTFEAYRKESERLLWWLASVEQSSLRDLRREGWMRYELFLADPPASWIGQGAKRTSATWRPFRKALAEQSVRYALRVLGDLMRYLRSTGYVQSNPLEIARRGRSSRPKTTERFLPPDSWPIIRSALDAMPTKTPTQIDEISRAVFLFVWMESTGVRASEMCDARMDDVYPDTRGTDRSWWWRVSGKGDKVEDVPVNRDALNALRAYRQHLNLPALPSGDESGVALVWGLRGPHRHQGVTRSTLYRQLKRLFVAAADQVRPHDPHMARTLESASTHWLRHSAASNALDASMSIHDVQSLLRHSDINTTLTYVHSDRQARHRASERRSALNRSASETPPSEGQ